MLVRWADGTNEPSTKPLTFQVFFFCYILRALKTLYFHFCNFIEKWKNKEKGFLQRVMQDFMKKKKYLEHQTLGRRNVCPIGPAN